MAEEKLVVLNLRKILKNSPRGKRRSRASHALKNFLQKKSNKVRVDAKLNQRMWSVGSRGTIGKVRIKVKKRDDGTVSAETAE